MKRVYTVTQAAQELGLARRTAYNYLRGGLLPHEKLSEGRTVMTREHVDRVAAVLERHGSQGVRAGRCLTPVKHE